MVGTVRNEEYLAKYEARPHSFFGAMKDVLNTGLNRYYVVQPELAKKQDRPDIRCNLAALSDVTLTSEEQRIYDEIDRRFSYRYPDEKLLTAKAKYSVSELRRDESAAEISKKGGSMLSSVTERSGSRPRRVSAAEIGTAYHRIMEFLDFERITDDDGGTDSQYIAERADFLHQHGAIEDAVFDALDLQKVVRFFESDLGQRALSAFQRGSLRREKPFTLRIIRDGREIMVQGVIDCCFEEDGKMVIIDYKSGFVMPGIHHCEELRRIQSEYRVQIELYSEAVSMGTGMEVKEAYLYLFTTDEAVLL